MAFSPDVQTMDSQVGGHSIPRNSPQVARIISPPVADTTWPHSHGQVMAGATRRRRHSLPQPVVPDAPPSEKTEAEKNLPQHMNLDTPTTSRHSRQPLPFLSNPPYNPFTMMNSSPTLMSCGKPTESSSSLQGRTMNGVTMELDYEPPSFPTPQINFGGCGGGSTGGFEAGIPFTRPPQLTLHSPTSSVDGESGTRGSHQQSLGKSHHNSIVARKAAR